MKKNLLFIFGLLALVVLVSCEAKYSNVKFGVDLNGTSGRLDSTGVKPISVSLYYNSAWEAMYPDWVTITPKSGQPKVVEVLDTVQLVIIGKPNETGKVRSGRVQIIAPNGVDLSFNVWQNPQPAK